MFSRFFKKKQSSISVNQPIAVNQSQWLTPLMPVYEGLPRPDWEKIDEYITQHLADQDANAVWSQVALDWMSETANALAHDYYKTETPNFIIISHQGEIYNKSLAIFLERTRSRLLSVANGITQDNGYGKHVVIVFADIDSYYSYISFYGPQEGTYGLSSGMYLNYGYGHFVFHEGDLDMAEPIAAHEMTHALLAHLPIPTWLNEGMAVNMEAVICGTEPPRLTPAVYRKHQAYWSKEQNIQHFWSGASFSNADAGQELSYQLAQILVTNLSKNYDSFVVFANSANEQDGGESAMQEIYHLSLGDLVASTLGEGDWAPKLESHA